jgi:hypothetical protein
MEKVTILKLSIMMLTLPVVLIVALIFFVYIFIAESRKG